MTRKNKLAVAVMVLIGATIFLYEMRTVDVQQMWATLLKLRLRWLVVAAIAILASWVVEAFVVRLFVEHPGEKLSFKAALRVPLVEQLFNNITPFSSGGQPAQLIALMQAGVEAGRASSVLLMKFIVYQFIVLLNFVITIVIGFEHIAGKFQALAWFIVFGFIIHVVVIVGLLLVMYQYRFTKRLVRFIVRVGGRFVNPKRLAKWQQNIDGKIDSFYKESLLLKKEKARVLKASAMTMVQLLLYYVVPYFVLLSFGASPVSLIKVMVMHVMIVMIVSLFPIPGGAGGAEYSFKTLFGTFVASSSQLLLAMLLWRFLTYYLGMLLGIIALTVAPDKIGGQSTDTA